MDYGNDNDRTVVRTGAGMGPGRGMHGGEVGGNALPVGMRIGEFEITDLIGEGGFGIVYLAYDHSLDRHVAVKEYMPGSLASRTQQQHVTVRSQHHIDTFAAGLRSFVNEAKLLAQFDSPSLVKVYRFWEANGTAYMAMPYYDGITLKQALKARHIVPREDWIKDLLANLFDAVETIHAVKCYHRDIAPDNILLLKNGHPVLLDFGAARRVIGDLTQGPTVILKPGFAPIEQYADIPGLKQGPWTDVYALAAVVYFLITGKSPPPAVSRVVHDDMVPARTAGQGQYSTLFLAAIDHALAVRPENRIQTVPAMRRELQIEGRVAHTAPLRAPTAGMPPTEALAAAARPMVDTRSNREHAFAPSAAPPANWMRTMSTDKRDLPAARKRGKGTWIVFAVCLCAGVASGVLYWQIALGPQRKGAPLAPEPEVAASADALSPAPSRAPEPSVTPQVPELPAQPALAQPPPAVAPPVSSPPPALVDAAPAPPAPTAPPAQESATRPSPEDELWRAARASDRTTAYRAYLNKFPNGRYAAAAKQRLEGDQPKTALVQPGRKASALPEDKQITPAPSSGAPGTDGDSASSTPTSPSPEEELWSMATNRDQAPAYETYLDKYPNGRYREAAQDKLAKLKPAEPAPPVLAPVPKQADPSPPEQAIIPDKPAAAPQAMPKPEIPEPPAAAREVPAAGAKNTYTLANQTMAGDFNADPVTGVVSGHGKITWKNGDQFEGTLVHGVKEGKGVFIWANGQRYSGDWARDKPHGKGTISFANGNRYEGEVRDGLPQGKGKFVFSNGNRYEGDVKDGAAHGKGTIIFASGDRYEGDIREGLQHGQGVSKFKSGDVYAGAWVAGKSQGHGRYTWANGSYWEGEFSQGKQTENGNLVRADKAAAGATDSASSGGAGARSVGDQVGSHATGGDRADTKP